MGILTALEPVAKPALSVRAGDIASELLLELKASLFVDLLSLR